MELNADVGEGGADALVIPHVQRVSIACGGHVGDADSMRATLVLAREHGVLAGAHPSYPDPANFGRLAIEASSAEIRSWVVEQTRSLRDVAENLGVDLFHVKPHGALYNQAAHDREVAQGVIDALLELEGLALIALAGSPLVGWAREAGVNVLEEAFADRRYLKNGQLSSRTQAGAVIEERELAVAQALAIARGAPVLALGQAEIMIKADTLCLHGEGPEAAELARLIASGLAHK